MSAIPTVTMIGPAGQVVVNHNDEALMRAKGYVKLGEALEKAKAAPPATPIKKPFTKKSNNSTKG